VRAQPSAATLSRLERSAGALATQAVSRMDEELTWFRAMPAAQRSWVMLVAQAGIASMVEWCRHPGRPPRLTGEVFGAAPRELVRAIPLKHTVDLIKVTVEVVEDRVEQVAEPGDAEQLRLAVLQYSREVAFATAHVYASFAESRGAWDARLEALVVDALVRGERSEELPGRAAALGWATTGPVLVLVGAVPAGVDDQRSAVRRAARSQHSEALVGVHADKLVVVLGGVSGLEEVATRVSREFGDGPVVRGPRVESLAQAGESATAALAGLRAAAAWPEAPRPVAADDLLPERALAGDPAARSALAERIAVPLQAAGAEVLETVRVVLGNGGNLEASARALFVHTNTVRYRLKRATELTGYSPTDPRGSWTLQVALALTGLEVDRSLWH
jgi:PucR-like helix-turn-helix protein/diguanylate cyclase with GGDEF domain